MLVDTVACGSPVALAKATSLHVVDKGYPICRICYHCHMTHTLSTLFLQFTFQTGFDTPVSSLSCSTMHYAQYSTPNSRTPNPVKDSPLPDCSTRGGVARQPVVDVHTNTRVRAHIRPRERNLRRRPAPPVGHRHLCALEKTRTKTSRPTVCPSATPRANITRIHSPRCKIVPITYKQ